MLIVIEGCDGSGKSTLAKFLSDLLGGTIVHLNSNTTNNLVTMIQIIDSSKESGNVIIMDRSMYGQFVYQTDLQREQRGWLNSEDISVLESRMLSAGVVPILCVADEETLKQRIAQRADSADDFDKLNQLEIQDKFIELMKKKSMLPWIKVSSKHIEWGKLNE